MSMQPPISSSATPLLTASSWWAAGDFAPRPGCRVQPFVDGHSAMLDMCRSFLSARRFILLAGWDLHAELPMVRGSDVHVDDEHDRVHQVQTASLREGGLDEEVVAFWSAGNLRVMDILGFAVRRGVRVGVLLWDAFHQGSHLTNDPAAQRAMLATVGVECL